jgi:hypothetical protein
MDFKADFFCAGTHDLVVADLVNPAGNVLSISRNTSLAAKMLGQTSPLSLE